MSPSQVASDTEAWEELSLTAGALPTEDAPWALAALASFPGGKATIALERDGRCDAVAALVRRGPILELAGARELGEPCGVLARSPQALEELAGRMAAAGRGLLFHRIRKDSPTLQALRKSRATVVSAREGVGYPVIELDERWQESGGGLSSSRRSALRRSRRKAERLGEVSAQLLRPEPAEVEALLDEAFAIESRSWKGSEGTALTQVPAMEAFFRRYAAELAARRTLRLDFLTIGGRRVAMQLGAEWNHRHWLFKIGYDAAYRAASPGQLLLAESVAAAARDGLEGYELLGSRDTWTDAWTKLVHPCVKAMVLPQSPRAAVALGSIRWQEARRTSERQARRARQRLAEAASARHVAGPELEDALAVERRYAECGYATSVGFWNGRSDSPEEVAANAFASARALGPGSEVSVKLAPIGGDSPVLDELAACCDERGLRLHLDALRPETASLAHETALRLQERWPGMIGDTLPGRWGRSLADAEQLRSRALNIRVVKGEVPDETDEEPDMYSGFLAVVEALAGGAVHVEVATQDAGLARRALEVLAEADTSCELQVLHATASTAAVRVARRLGVSVRVYVPYGTGRLPYGQQAIGRRPLRSLSLARDLLPIRARQPLLLAQPLLAMREMLPF